MSVPSVPKGISEKNRGLLATLHRGARGPFTVREAADLLSLNITRTQRFLAYLATRGWLVRIRRGLYATVPLDAVDPADRYEDPWIIASKVFSPSFYIGGWTACEYWDLTEQLFRDMVVITTRKLRQRDIKIQGFPYHVKRTAEYKTFGTQTVWRDRTRVTVSDPARTVVDILDTPYIGGGIRHVVEVLETYLRGECRRDALLVQYVRRLGNRTVFKRLGYLLETIGVAAPVLVETCGKEMGAGISLLDPTIPVRGPILRRWNLRLNVELVTGGASR